MAKYPRKVIAKNTDSEDKRVFEFTETSPGTFIGFVTADQIEFPKTPPPPSCTIEMKNGFTLSFPLDGNLNLKGASMDGLIIEGNLSKKQHEELFLLATDIEITWPKK
jgi:hypothetical protein